MPSRDRLLLASMLVIGSSLLAAMVVPVWFYNADPAVVLVPAFGAMLGVLLVMRRADARRRARRRHGQCPACGYDRRASAANAPCPECGRSP